MSKSRLVVGVSFDALNAIFYHADGSGTTILSTSDPRTAPLITEAMDAQSRGDIANLVFSEEDVVSYYESFNRQNKKGYRLFKMASRFLSRFWKAGEANEVSFPAVGTDCPLLNTGNPFVPETTEVSGDKGEPLPVTSLERALNLDQGTLKEPDMVGADETIVVVDNEGNALPYMERLLTQFAEAFTSQDTSGLEALIERLLAVDEARQHSVEDALTFIQRSDMRITTKGDLIGYKALRKIMNGKDLFAELGVDTASSDIYADAYTGRVVQRIGTLVQVNESLIDLNRRNECSSGLHIARRRYLSSWRQDACFLVLLKPEDIYTVPHGDPNKVRVRAYQILHKLSSDQYSELLRDRPFTDSPTDGVEGGQVLATLLAGNYPDVTEVVTINGSHGADLSAEVLVETKTEEDTAKVAVEEGTQAVAGISDVDVGQDRQRPQVAPNKRIKPSAVNKKVVKKPVSNRDKAALIMKRVNAHSSLMSRRDAAKELQALKRKAKVTWKALGLSDREIEKVTNLLNNK